VKTAIDTIPAERKRLADLEARSCWLVANQFLDAAVLIFRTARGSGRPS
jgi:hypothetical protein